MRTIKFRGKRVNRNGQWAYGDLRQLSDRVLIVPSLSDDAAIDRDTVDPETIGQYTGLHDQNDKEIYEGDIVHIREYNNKLFDNFDDDPNRFDLFTLDEIQGEMMKEYITPIIWVDGIFCFSSEYNNSDYRNDMLFCCLCGDMRRSSTIFEIKVIGNIYDNPELLKKIRL